MNHVVAFIHEEGGVFGVSFPDFPGAVTTADTLDAALVRAQQVLSLHVAGMAEDKVPMPALRTADAVLRDPALAEERAGAILAAIPVDLPGRSVRINITIDEHLLAAIDRKAQQVGSSRSGFLAEAARTRLVEA